MDKQQKYDELVLERKRFSFTSGLLNPSQIDGGKYDTISHIGPWSAWQGNLDAKILVVGQDWGDIDYFRTNKGTDTDDNPTNKNLAELFKVVGIDVGKPSAPNHSAPTFFTNAILGIKTDGGMSAKVRNSWAKESTENFLRPLLEIIEPEIIITLGAVAYNEIARIYHLSKQPLKKLIFNGPIRLSDSTRLYPRYHCGGLGLANRPIKKQKQDWSQIEVNE